MEAMSNGDIKSYIPLFICFHKADLTSVRGRGVCYLSSRRVECISKERKGVVSSESYLMLSVSKQCSIMYCKLSDTR